MNTADLSIEISSTTSQSPHLQSTLDGGLLLTMWVRAEVQRTDSYNVKDPPPEKQIVLQALPSSLSIADQLLCWSQTGHVFGVSIDGMRRRAEQSLPLKWALSREHLYAIETARKGRAAEFSSKHAFACQDGPKAWTWEFDLRFRVPASDWADLLTAQGVARSLHVAIPLGPNTDLSTNAHLRTEFDRARRLYETGDYSGSVASVRDVWALVIKEYDPIGRWDALFEKNLPLEVSGAMKGYAAALRAVVNLGHHRGVTADGGQPALYQFTQRDAEFVLQSAAALFRYFGRLARD